MSMNIYAKNGDKVIVTNLSKNNGYSVDKEKVAKYLKVGIPYEVLETHPEDFNTDVTLKEFPEFSFNSVMFEDF